MRRHDIEMLLDIYKECNEYSVALAQGVVEKVARKVKDHEEEVFHIFEAYRKGEKDKEESWSALDNLYSENFIYTTYVNIAPIKCDCGEGYSGMVGNMNEEMHMRAQCSNCGKELVTLIQNGVFDEELEEKMKEDGFK